MYAIDLDSSSSGNLVVNNYMTGCIWEGIFTEYRAAHNIITGNTVIGHVANNAHIHLNGELNFAVDNLVQVNATVPGGIAVSSSLSMYDSYALSNVVVANSAGVLYFSGDGGCANYASENVVDVTIPGSAAATHPYYFKTTALPNASYCVPGVDTMQPVVFRDVGTQRSAPPTPPPGPTRHAAVATSSRGL
jgi:parallel beta-helix repeat protein